MNVGLLENIPCPICHNTDLKTLSDQGQHGLTCHVKICPHDGFVFLSPRWSKGQYFSFYELDYDRYYRKSVFGSENDKTKFSNIKLICNRLLSADLMKPDYRSVLDVGSGMGHALDYIKNNFSNFTSFNAIEASEHCKNNLEKNNINIVAADIDDDWEGGYDLIIMRHVLEHALDPIKTLNRLSRSLNDDGVLYISVPDMMNPKGSLNKYWFRAVHTFYFSKNTLVKSAELGNLSPIHIDSKNHELWGVFKKKTEINNPNQPIKLTNVYNIQKSVIKRHKIKLLLNKPFVFTRKVVSKLIPLNVKGLIK